MGWNVAEAGLSVKKKAIQHVVSLRMWMGLKT